MSISEHRLTPSSSSWFVSQMSSIPADLDVLLVDVVVVTVVVLVVGGVGEPNDARASMAVSGVVVVEMVRLVVDVVVTGEIAVMLSVMLLMDVVVRNVVVLVVVGVDGHVVTEVGAVGVLVVVVTSEVVVVLLFVGTGGGVVVVVLVRGVDVVVVAL